MRICVIGTRHIGLILDVYLAHIRHDVLCVDSNQVATEITLDSRIGSKFLQAGIGWGSRLSRAYPHFHRRFCR
jgi:UDP-glucose 6-dehydrogenase